MKITTELNKRSELLKKSRSGYQRATLKRPNVTKVKIRMTVLFGNECWEKQNNAKNP